MRKWICLFIIFGWQIFGEIPETVRKEYANKFYHAFRLQCEGRSGQAFYSFQEGFLKGKQAGESIVKLQIIADLFYWYRRNGNHLKLFSRLNGQRNNYR